MKSVPRILSILLTLPLVLIVAFAVFDDYSVSVFLICSIASFIVLLRWKFLNSIAETVGKKEMLIRSGSLYFLFFLLTVAVLVVAIVKLPSSLPWVLAIILTQPVVLVLYSLVSGIRMLFSIKDPSP